MTRPPTATATAGPDLPGLSRTLRGQMPVLDALRGVAILLVMGHRFDLTPDPESLRARVASAFLEGGWVGVQLFFVLSGFLITGILLDSAGRNGYFKTFYVRRSLRIFPLYYAVLIVSFVIVPLITGKHLQGSEHQIWLWTYLSNWTSPLGLEVDLFPHFWSLAVEEQFYLVWPLLVYLTSRSHGSQKPTTRRFPILCIGLILFSIASRVALRAYGYQGSATADQYSHDIVYQNTFCRVEALAMGAIAAWALRKPDLAAAIAARRSVVLASSLALFVTGGIVTHGYPRTTMSTQTIGYTILAWTSLVILVYAVLAEARRGLPPAGTFVSSSRFGKLLAPAPLRVIGKYSYALYVFHGPLHHLVGLPMLVRLGEEHAGGAGGPGIRVTLAYFVVMTAVTFAASVASYHLLEKHFLRLKDRFRTAS